MIGHHILVLKIPLDTASYRLPYGSDKLKENQDTCHLASDYITKFLFAV